MSPSIRLGRTVFALRDASTPAKRASGRATPLLLWLAGDVMVLALSRSGAGGLTIGFSLNNAAEDLRASLTIHFGQAGSHRNSLIGDVRSDAVDPRRQHHFPAPLNSLAIPW
jgi:hypothetical protein